MTDFLRLALIFIAAVNPAWAALVYSRLHNPGDLPPWQTRAVPVAVGTAIAAAMLLAAALLADPLLDALDVELETFRVAAGIVMAGMGVVTVIGRRPLDVEDPAGWSQGIYPLAVPLFAGPAAIVAAVIYSLDEGAGQTLAAAAIALALAAVLTLASGRWPRPFLAAAAPLLGALLVLIAAGLIVDGVQAI